MRETTFSQLCVVAIESQHDSYHAAGIPVVLWKNYCDTEQLLLAVQLAHVLHCIDPDGLGLEELDQRTGS